VSKAQAVITAVISGGFCQARAAGMFGVSPGWVSRLLARYRQVGEAAFQPQSRLPASSPRAIASDVAEAVLAERDRLTTAGDDAGPETIRWHLACRQVVVSRASIARILSRHDRIVPAPQKRPKSSYIRFQADQPNQCW
jgi:hypothetical protein